MVRAQMKFIFKWLCIGLSVVMMSGCQYSMLNPAGVIASAQKNLMITALILMLLVVIPVIILTLVFAWRYRASNTKAKYTPEWGHNNWLEFVWWTIPCLIIIALGIITYISSYDLDPYRPIKSDKKPLEIQVIAMNWKWLFIYPEQKIASVNYLEMPIDTPVRFVITSDGPMNSFWIPAIGGQIMAMPGMQTQLHEKATKLGISRGASANISGAGFSTMHFKVHVVTHDAFNAWVNKAKQSPLIMNQPTYARLSKPSGNNAETFYALKDQDLFKSVIMKYMEPPGMQEKVDHKTRQKN